MALISVSADAPVRGITQAVEEPLLGVTGKPTQFKTKPNPKWV